MEVENIGNQTIKIEAFYNEVAKIVHTLDEVWMINKDYSVR